MSIHATEHALFAICNLFMIATALSCSQLTKLFYLALKNISKKWTMPIRDWKSALNRFSIQFDDRMPKH